MLATIATSRKEPITEAEVARVRAKAAKYFDDVISDPQRLGVAISESIALGDWRLFFIQRDRYRDLTAADVQRVALDYLKRSNLTVGEFIPDAQARSGRRPRARRRRGTGQRLQGRSRGERRRGVRHEPGQSRGPHAALHAPERHEGRAAAQEDARRRGRFRADAAFWRREVGVRQAARRHADRSNAAARHRPSTAGRRSTMRCDQLRARVGVSGSATGASASRPDLPRAAAGRRCASSPRCCATPCLPAGGTRQAEARAHHAARGRAHRSAADRARARCAATAIRIRRAIRATHRRSTKSLADHAQVTRRRPSRASTRSSTARATPSSPSSATSTPRRCAR